jgi:hypothetical protein
MFVPIFLAALAFAPARASVCSQADIRKAAQALRPDRAALAKFVIVDDSDPAIPARARPVIADMKTKLAELSAAYMRCAPEGLDARTAQNDLAPLADTASPKTVDRYGQQLDIAVTRMPLHFVAINAGFNVKCATDEVVSIFEDQGGIWRERMRVQNPPYKDAAGATSDLEVKISLPDKAGDWFAVSKSVAPWCSSTWSLIRYAVLRPGADPATPHVLFHRDDSIWWGGEDFGRLSVGVQDFDLRFHAESIDPGRHNREWIRDFSVTGDQVRRMPMIALSPQDFAEEWIQSKWDDAQAWTSPAAHLKVIHDTLHAEPFAEYKSIRSCGPAVQQIEIQQTEADTSVFLTVSGSPDFTMMAVSTRSDPACRGKNLYDPAK